MKKRNAGLIKPKKDPNRKPAEGMEVLSAEKFLQLVLPAFDPRVTCGRAFDDGAPKKRILRAELRRARKLLEIVLCAAGEDLGRKIGEILRQVKDPRESRGQIEAAVNATLRNLAEWEVN